MIRIDHKEIKRNSVIETTKQVFRFVHDHMSLLPIYLLPCFNVHSLISIMIIPRVMFLVKNVKQNALILIVIIIQRSVGDIQKLNRLLNLTTSAPESTMKSMIQQIISSTQSLSMTSIIQFEADPSLCIPTSTQCNLSTS